MGLNLSDFEHLTTEAVKTFWENRYIARQKQIELGISDKGERAGVTGGKNMDGFIALAKEIVIKNGLSDAEIHLTQKVLTLPGYFRPTKLWDMLVVRDNRLIAALEFKSHVGPSFSNNFNNRAEEAIGTAVDLWTAYREEAFGTENRPFVGWLILVEDCESAHKPVTDRSPHFPIFPDFKDASYITRYDIMCKKLMQEQLYNTATTIISPREGKETGEYLDLNESTGIKRFIREFAVHIIGEAAR